MLLAIVFLFSLLAYCRGVDERPDAHVAQKHGAYPTAPTYPKAPEAYPTAPQVTSYSYWPQYYLPLQLYQFYLPVQLIYPIIPLFYVQPYQQQYVYPTPPPSYVNPPPQNTLPPPPTTTAKGGQEEMSIVEITVTDEAVIENEYSSTSTMFMRPFSPAPAPMMPMPPGFAADMEVITPAETTMSTTTTTTSTSTTSLVTTATTTTPPSTTTRPKTTAARALDATTNGAGNQLTNFGGLDKNTNTFHTSSSALNDPILNKNRNSQFRNLIPNLNNNVPDFNNNFHTNSMSHPSKTVSTQTFARNGQHQKSLTTFSGGGGTFQTNPGNADALADFIANLPTPDPKLFESTVERRVVQKTLPIVRIEGR